MSLRLVSNNEGAAEVAQGKPAPADHRHLVYNYLLFHCLMLEESLAKQAGAIWYGFTREELDNVTLDGRKYAGEGYTRLWNDGVRAVPDKRIADLYAVELAKRLDPSGVAGFYREGAAWRLNLDATRTAVLRPYKDVDGRVLGLMLYKHLNDREPRVLTSRGMEGGVKALPYQPERTPFQ